MRALNSIIFFLVSFLVSSGMFSLTAKQIQQSDTLKKQKIILMYDSAFRYDPVTYKPGYAIGKFNCFKIGEEGSKIALGEKMKNLVRYVSDSPETVKAINRSRLNNKVENFFIGWMACFFLMGVIFFKLSFLLGGLAAFLLTVIGILGWLFFSKRAEKQLQKAIDRYNKRNGY